MHSSTSRERPQSDDIHTTTRDISTESLGWRDLRDGDALFIELRYTTAHLREVAVSYRGTSWSFTVTDPVLGEVRPCDDGAWRAQEPSVTRAIRSALDVVGVKVTHDPRFQQRTRGQS